MAEPGADLDVAVGGAVRQFEGHDVLAGKAEHREAVAVAQVDAADRAVSEGAVELERDRQIGDAVGGMQRLHPTDGLVDRILVRAELGQGVGLAMDEFPLAVLHPEDHDDPKRAGGHPASVGEVGFEPFHLEDEAVIGAGFPRDLLEDARSAFREPVRRKIQTGLDVRPTAPIAAERVGERDIVTPRPEFLLWLRVALQQRRHGALGALDRPTKVRVRGFGHRAVSSMCRGLSRSERSGQRTDVRGRLGA